MPYRRAHYYLLLLIVLTAVAFWPSYFAVLPGANIAQIGLASFANTEKMLRDARAKLKDVLPGRVPRSAEVRSIRG